MFYKLVAGFLMALVLCAGQSRAKEAGETISIAEGKVQAEKPAKWDAVKPRMSMIEHEFSAPKDSQDPARITIMQASGSVDENILRWVAQFESAKKEDAKIETMKVDDCEVHLFDLSGTWVGMGGPFAAKKEDFRMFAAIVETKSAGKIFIKMVGPTEVVGEQVDAMKLMLKSIKVK